VIGYYQRFLENFPTVEHLAAAPLEAVIDLWSGLGYYARARNLHAAAVMVVEEFFGDFPQTVSELQRLPGVGRSTAGAISSLAFDNPAPILDGNVRRILCRLFALQDPARSTASERQLWEWAELLTPQGQVHDYTQAIMDLGALICLPRKPRCESCPLDELCRAYQLGLAEQLPVKQATKKIPLRQDAALLLERQGRYLVRRRPAYGFLGGLWEFPTVSLNPGELAEIKLRRLLGEFGVVGKLENLGSINHVYSHFRLQLQIYKISLDDWPRVAGGEGGWYSFSQLEELALHGAHKKALGLVPKTGG